MEESTAVALAVGLIALISGGLAGTQLDKLFLEKYTQCRKGDTYGTWLAQKEQYLYQCDLTEEYELCYNTTKTRCYLIDTKALADLLEQNVSIQDTENPEIKNILIRTTINVKCMGPECTDLDKIKGDLKSKGII